MERGAHITRYVMYERLKQWTLAGDVLAISGSWLLACTLGAKRVWIADYPQTDMLALDYPDGEFDGVVADQVLEHVRGCPSRALRECVRVVRPGGFVVLTTCCVNPVHGRPDFWRFTPEALEFLAPQGCEVLEFGGWGNPLVWVLTALRLRFVPVPHAKWHPLNWVTRWNHPDWPVVTWLVLRKGE